MNRRLSALFFIVLGLMGCSASHTIVMLGDHMTSKELRKAQFFNWSKNAHVLNVGNVSQNDGSHAQESAYLTDFLDFDPALANQQFRASQIKVDDLIFDQDKGSILPSNIQPGWMDTLFQKQRSIQMIDASNQVISDVTIYLPLPMKASLSEEKEHFDIQWEPDTSNPNGVSIWFNSVRGPNTGYPGKIKGFNRTYNADDRLGNVTIQKNDLPEWIWEDPDHTSLSVIVFRRTTKKGDIVGQKQDLRVVATQGKKFSVLTPSR